MSARRVPTTPHVEGQPIGPHTYVNYGCRCDGCREARTVYQREYRERNTNYKLMDQRRKRARDRARRRLAEKYKAQYRALFNEELRKL